MKLALFQELLDLNRGIRTGNARPERLEKVQPFSKEQIRGALAECETARVDTNREFFDNFEAMVEDDASWAYKFHREYHQKTKDPGNIYFETKASEESARTRAWRRA